MSEQPDAATLEFVIVEVWEYECLKEVNLKNFAAEKAKWKSKGLAFPKDKREDYDIPPSLLQYGICKFFGPKFSSNSIHTYTIDVNMVFFLCVSGNSVKI